MHHKKNLLLSVAVSLILHLISLHFATAYSIWFASPEADQHTSNTIVKLSRDQILKETFANQPSKKLFTQYKPLHEPHSASLKSFPLTEPSFTSFHLSSINTSSSIFFPDQLLSLNQTISFRIPAEEGLNLFEHLPSDLILPAPPLSTYSLPPPEHLPEQQLCLRPPMAGIENEPPKAKISYEEPLLSSVSLRDSSVQPKSPLFTPQPHLPELPSLIELETASYSDSFDTDIVFLPREEQEGYIFALTLIPRTDLQLSKIKQNYSFLIDKSNSIQKERLTAAKNAVYKALDEMDLDDTFNIIAFDSKIEKLSPNSLPYSVEAVKAAKAFLDKIELGSFFSSANLFKPLFLTIPPLVKEDEIHTAIVLTDGELLNKGAAQRSLLYEWTNNNCGRVTLFGLGLGSDPHLSSLEIASAFNRGSMSYSPTKGSIKRKLLKLMKTISHPIAKNLSCRAIGLNGPAQITLYRKAVQMPHLYLNEPYVIIGTADTLDNFILFVQGRLKDQWIHIKKKISFAHAKKGGAGLKSEWAMQRVYGLYEQYIYDNDPNHLNEAQILLEPYNLQVVFQ
jgi:hypothetical protein